MTADTVRRRTQAGMLAISVVAGVVAASAARHALTQRFNALEAAAQVPTVSRVVAIDSLQPGERLTVDTVALRDIPVSGAVSDAVKPEDFEQVEGALVLREIKAGEQILRVAVSVDLDKSLSSRLSEGRRAVTISVDDVSSQAGMLRPGDRLDILVTLDMPNGRMTVPLLRAVSILAVGRRASDARVDGPQSDETDALQASRDPFSTVTLDVDEPSAVRLIAARQVGVLSVVLRYDVVSEHAQALAPLARDVQVLLGLARPSPVRQARKVPVLYGARPDATLASGAMDTVAPASSRGLDESWQ